MVVGAKTYTTPFDAMGGSVWGIIDMLCGVGVNAYRKHAGENCNPRHNLERYFVNSRMVITENGRVLEKPRIAKINKAKYGYHIILKLYPGLTLRSLKLSELQAALNAEVDAEIDNSGWIHLRVYTRHVPKRFTYREELAAQIKKFDCAIPIGISRQGFVVLDMSRDENFALLVGGMPGFGKSRFLTQAITSVVMNYRPDQVQLYLTDMKNGVEFQRFQNVPHLLDWAGDLRGAGRVLTKGNTDLDFRAEKMRRVGVTNISEYNQVVKKKDRLPHILVVIDEYADLEKPEKEQVTRLCRMGRFAGLHPIVCTQRPSHTVLPGDTKALMPVTLCFRVRNALNSTMILGQDMPYAAFLRDKGRAILQTHRLREVQVMDLAPKKANAMILSRFPTLTEVKTYQLVSNKAASW